MSDGRVLLQDILRMPPADPRRVSYTLAVLRSSYGQLGFYEWETIHAVLSKVEAGELVAPVPTV